MHFTKVFKSNICKFTFDLKKKKKMKLKSKCEFFPPPYFDQTTRDLEHPIMCVVKRFVFHVSQIVRLYQ